MKKLIASAIALTVAAGVSYAQGTVTMTDVAPATYITTNGSSISQGTGNVRGTKQFYFALLVQTYPGTGTPAAITSSSLGNWIFAGVYGTNSSLTAGQVQSPATQTTLAGTWGAPSTAAYTSGTIDYYEIVGWSANEGSDWGTISNSIVGNTSWLVTGAGSWFGVSSVAYNYSGGGPNSLAATALFGNNTGLSGGGLSSGFALTPISSVPEPSTFALAALGGASLLLFRRRK